MKTAFVTGSTRGIGRGIADCLHEADWDVVYSGTRSERPEGIPEDCIYVGCDISSAASRAQALERVLAHAGRIDLLVNNAGVAPLVRGELLDMTEESFDRVIGVNLKGTLFMSQLAAREMLHGLSLGLEDYRPRIVNIGSISAYTSSVSRGEYCISKAGVAMVTKLFADRLASEGIPVFEVRPGIIATDMTGPVHEKYERMIGDGLLPLPRFGQPEDVARMVLACAEGYLDYSAGQVLNADGGFALRRL